MIGPLRLVLAASLLGLPLAGCSDLPAGSLPPARVPSGAMQPLPAMKSFAATSPEPARRSNRDMARDFLDLSFELESGRSLPVMTRFEGPIRVRLTGDVPKGMAGELENVLGRMRSEAKLDISRTDSADAQVTIQAVSGDEIRRFLPQAACFVVPNITSLKEYPSARRKGLTDWAQLTTREHMAIFVPADVAPQEMRDCLHEELAQSLGPLNDLYRLPDSVFNDDNIHTVLTGFDMLMLRVTYAPELHSGMTRGEVAAVLPGILRRINPSGEAKAYAGLPSTPRDWIDAVQEALGPGAGPGARQRAGQKVLQIAEREGWRDHRLAFSLYVYGRLAQGSDPTSARAAFETAREICARSPETRIHGAFSSAQLAAHALTRGDGQRALDYLQGQPELALQYQNAALLSSLLMLRAEALDQLNRPQEAATVRLDSLGWARYGFGPDYAVREKLGEIAALSPQTVTRAAQPVTP